MKIENDFKKWILFNNQLNDYHKLYELHSAISSSNSFGGVRVDKGEDFTLSISQDGYDSTLVLDGEDSRKKFFSYLCEHYFSNQDVEEWYSNKTEYSDKKNNHSIEIENFHNFKFSDFKVHPKETKYYKWRWFFSGLFYVLISVTLINEFTKSLNTGILYVGICFLIFLIFIVIKRITNGFFTGVIRGTSVPINENQYSEVYNIIKEQSEAVGLKDVPEVYVRNGDFNAFVTKLARRRFLILHSEVLETAMKGDFDVLKFVLGHEIGHLKRKHLNQEKWLFPSLFIPFLARAHSRGCEYTCDRYGFHFSEKGAIEGILILATGTKVFSKINVNKLIDDSNSEQSFWVWLTEKFQSHPYTFKRMTAIKKYAERGY